jgi:hypothetical protein
MSGRVYLLGMGLALTAGAFLLTDGQLWRPGLTKANVRRIRPGIGLAEVERILGNPPLLWQDIEGGDWGDGRPPLLRGRHAEREFSALWVSRQGDVRVEFGKEGKAKAATFLPPLFPPPVEQSPLARLRVWLGW